MRLLQKFPTRRPILRWPLENPSCPIIIPIFAHIFDDIADNNLEVPTLVICATACLLERSLAINIRQRRRLIGVDVTDAISIAMTKVVSLDKLGANENLATKTPVETGYQLAAIRIRMK